MSIAYHTNQKALKKEEYKRTWRISQPPHARPYYSSLRSKQWNAIFLLHSEKTDQA